MLSRNLRNDGGEMPGSLCTSARSIGLWFANPSTWCAKENLKVRCTTRERSACNAAPQFDGLMASERLLPCPVNWAPGQCRTNVIAEMTAVDRDKERKIRKKES